MVCKKQDTPYEKFTVDDFLQDEYFIYTMKNPSDESEYFWINVLNKPGFNPANFDEARQIIKSIHISYDDPFTNNEIIELWEKINSDSTPKINSRFLYYGIAIAASFALLIKLFIPGLPQDESTDQILAFVENNKQSFEKDSVIRLVLSEQKEIVSIEKESIIKYNSSEIIVAEKEIDKSELAVFNQLYVPNGKRSQLTLADGTHIWVNAGTSITYPVEFPENQREIYVNGEIYLEVAHDPTRPFIVRTNEMNITVLGTAFNVTAYESETTKKVVLTSGAVKITNSAHEEYQLKPSDKYEKADGYESITQVDTQKYTAWTKGMYYYESAQFSEIVKYLSRYYGKTIECMDNSAQLKCSGKLDILDELSTLLNHLELVLPIQILHENGKYLIKMAK